MTAAPNTGMKPPEPGSQPVAETGGEPVPRRSTCSDQVNAHARAAPPTVIGWGDKYAVHIHTKRVFKPDSRARRIPPEQRRHTETREVAGRHPLPSGLHHAFPVAHGNERRRSHAETQCEREWQAQRARTHDAAQRSA